MQKPLKRLNNREQLCGCRTKCGRSHCKHTRSHALERRDKSKITLSNLKTIRDKKNYKRNLKVLFDMEGLFNYHSFTRLNMSFLSYFYPTLSI